MKPDTRPSVTVPLLVNVLPSMFIMKLLRCRVAPFGMLTVP